MNENTTRPFNRVLFARICPPPIHNHTNMPSERRTTRARRHENYPRCGAAGSSALADPARVSTKAHESEHHASNSFNLPGTLRFNPSTYFFIVSSRYLKVDLLFLCDVYRGCNRQMDWGWMVKNEWRMNGEMNDKVRLYDNYINNWCFQLLTIWLK